MSQKPLKGEKCKGVQAPAGCSLAFLEQSGKRHAKAAQGNFLGERKKFSYTLVRFIGGYSNNMEEAW